MTPFDHNASKGAFRRTARSHSPLNSLGWRPLFLRLGSTQVWPAGEGPAGGGEGPEVQASFWGERLGRPELGVAHHQHARLGQRDHARRIHAPAAHRAETDAVARTQLAGLPAPLRLQRAFGHDQVVVAQRTFFGQHLAGSHAHLVEVPCRVAQAHELGYRPQQLHPLFGFHRPMAKEPSPTPSLNARRRPGATRRRRRSAPWLSPWTSTAKASIPWPAARSASAATRRVPMPCRCHPSATTIAMSAASAPGRREYCATPTTSPPSTAATAARSIPSTRRSALANRSGRVTGVKKRRYRESADSRPKNRSTNSSSPRSSLASPGPPLLAASISTISDSSLLNNK